MITPIVCKVTLYMRISFSPVSCSLGCVDARHPSGQLVPHRVHPVCQVRIFLGWLDWTKIFAVVVSAAIFVCGVVVLVMNLGHGDRLHVVVLRQLKGFQTSRVVGVFQLLFYVFIRLLTEHTDAINFVTIATSS